MTTRLHVLTFLVVLVLAACAQAQTFTTLYNFTGGSDGQYSFAGVIQDPAGNLYGTTYRGGLVNCGYYYGYSGCGAVYEMTPAGTETVLHSFSGYPDGVAPLTPVIRDKAGNLYGTTTAGGSSWNCTDGCGTVFKIDTAGNETVLYSFTGGSDGCYPLQGFVSDKASTLYGTTEACGSSGYGTVFKVTKSGKFTLLHSFSGGSCDGAQPSLGHLTMDKSGDLYGVTEYGGRNNYGVLYRLSREGRFTVLHSFKGGADGCWPQGSVVQDKTGNFYGTTYQCGSNNFGTIWKVSQTGKETILHNFSYSSSDGCYPWAGVARDSNGDLYGVTTGCGANYRGALYELNAQGTLTLLHSFDISDGALPVGEVWQTCKGTLYGTTAYGGYHGSGTVWSYVP